MRLWTIHPSYLDTCGLVALWRESLLAQKVLLNQTKGYKHHPQLLRFKAMKFPIKAIGYFLYHVWKEGEIRGYNFQKSKIVDFPRSISKIKVTSGQVAYEKNHLSDKLKLRNHDKYLELSQVKRVKLHPLFEKVKGEIESWEKY